MCQCNIQSIFCNNKKKMSAQMFFIYRHYITDNPYEKHSIFLLVSFMYDLQYGN